ncbi:MULTISPECIES: nucleoside deaminase [unclassified Sporosarcina]|uniref:nucleoside deaminase n=1 Tax=unclassified Sporosarcina TaxID=2647733 RepID=UPI000C16AD71|nr:MULTISPECIES: nucleoside deaminase [unclassified Sporosarcina]PIC99189.1 tRNA-specific adenosine deaminase [Sporosarcina sp. P29]PID04677.1 tRNA-specific adenosine deaminase [Sporosarcina sp. P30]PID07784.1 tRNA-specific adenosine deaminase [Sporosarcina sp. P31]PID11017.1 tRNA-specific adenosine deaminase [Sporosarcina sp. P32b]
MLQENEMKHLQRAVELAEIALHKGDQPFGSVLVSASGEVLAEDHNRTSGGDPTQHPEFALARWAADHMDAEDRAKATVFTSGEHCPMCASAHGLVGLGRIVYASSSKQLAQWKKEMGVTLPAPVKSYPIQEMVPAIEVVGPVEEYAEQVRELQRQYHQKNN